MPDARKSGPTKAKVECTRQERHGHARGRAHDGRGHGDHGYGCDGRMVRGCGNAVAVVLANDGEGRAFRCDGCEQ